MLCIVSVLTVALAGGASAFTPPGFEPSSTNDLTVAYGSKLATNGIQMLRAGKLLPLSLSCIGTVC